MGRVPKKRVLCQCVRNATKQYVALKFLGFLLISIVELKNGYFETQQWKCQKPKNFNATYCFVTFLSHWPKTGFLGTLPITKSYE